MEFESTAKTLIMDTTSDSLFLCLLEGEKVRAKRALDCNFQHSVILLAEVDSMIKEQGLNISDIDIFALSIGPGSFTGIRIGVCSVLGFAFSGEQKIVAVNSLEADAYNYIEENSKVLSILDAKHGNAYYGQFDLVGQNVHTIDMGFAPREQIEKLKKSADIISSSKENSFGAEITENYYDGFIKLVQKKIALGEFTDITKLEPLYLKLSQAEEEMPE